jgi:PTH1 family peptidyl-tRNA hydrolase
MYLIVGLGNPGLEYAKNRHNVGFMAVEQLAKKAEPFGKVGFDSEKKLEAEITKTKIGDTEIIICKPQTFMNLSGKSVSKIMDYYDVEPYNTIVISDDTNLELGQVRVRSGGDSGGHNGLKSIISSIGQDFWRVRIGIGENVQIPLEDYVLQNPSDAELKIIADMIDKTADYLLESISNNSLENHTIN